MRIDPRFWTGKRVCVTGGTGFLGWHLVRALLPVAGHVRVLGLKPRSPALLDQLRHLDCVEADIRDPVAVRAALADRDIVFHAAGTVAVWGPAIRVMNEIHERGTQNVLDALPPRARLVHTSSVVAIGGSLNREPLTEASPFRLTTLRVDYVHTKKAAEDTALAAARNGTDVVVVNPGYLVGPEDYDGSVMGRLCLRVWKNKVPLVPSNGLNFVDVRDVALGHLLAAERGQSGRRHILGGENLLMSEFVEALMLERGITRRRPYRMPQWLHAVIACGGEVCAHFRRREPYPSMQQYRLGRYFMHYSSELARAELGYAPRPLATTIRDLHEWCCQTGLLPRPATRQAA